MNRFRLFCCALWLSFFAFPSICPAQMAKTPRETALDFLRANYERFDLTASDVADVRVSDEFSTAHNGLTHVWAQQRHAGLPVFNGLFGLHVRPDGAVLALAHRFVSHLSEKVNATQTSISAEKALRAALDELGFGGFDLPKLTSQNGPNEWLFEGGAVSQRALPVSLGFQPMADGSVRLAWSLLLRPFRSSDLWSMYVDASNGLILNKINLTASCRFDAGEASSRRVLDDCTGGHDHFSNIENEKCASPAPPNAAGTYRVFALPVESPIHGNRSLAAEGQNAASPFGWHDQNGQAGAEFTYTRGNNIRAYEDSDNNNAPPTSEVDGGAALVFDFSFDPNAEPEQNKQAAVTNLFYTTNRVHDIAHSLGFDAPAGAYQQNNYGQSGVAGDPVFAQALDGNGTDNAQFIPSPDGEPGILEMFKWSGTFLLTVNAPAEIAGSYLSRGAVGWGAPITSTPVTGQVAIADDGFSSPSSLGCGPSLTPLAGKIALVDRGDCTYGEKALFAEQKGAIGCIICNYENQLKNMLPGVVGDQVTIPVIAMRKSDCDILRSRVPDGLQVSIVKPPANGPEFLDGAFDNGIVTHEYAHGISNRLTGGPSTAGCLGNPEQMGEGWSDFFALALTARAGDTGEKPRGVGPYVYREGPTGDGVRRFPYSTDMGVNPLTFGNVGQNVQIHALGEVWCSMLWDMFWDMVAQYGFSEDFSNPNAGNVRALRLVMDGMKLQPCGPGFKDARDAILLADQQNYGGENQCLIWRAFARRGLGKLASQGSPDNAADGLENFDLPLNCQQTLTLTKTVTPLLDPGQDVTVSLMARNGKSELLTGVVISDEIPAGLTVNLGSVGSGGVVSGNKITWNIGALAPGQMLNVGYTAKTDPAKPSLRFYYNDLETDASEWLSYSIDPDNPSGAFLLQNQKANSGDIAWKVDNFAQAYDVILADEVPRPVSGARPVFRFWHAWNVEPGYDGGFVEISNNNGNSWKPVPKSRFLRNRYTGGVEYFTLAIPYLDGFWGVQSTFKDSYIDLSDYAGQNIRIRFRFASNNITGADGWYIDDPEWLDLVSYNSEACVVTSQGDSFCASAAEGGTFVNSNGTIPTAEPTEAASVRVFPNPARDHIYIGVNRDLPEGARVSLLGADGRELRTTVFSTVLAQSPLVFEAKGLAAGIYFLKIAGKDFAAMQRVVLD